MIILNFIGIVYVIGAIISFILASYEQYTFYKSGFADIDYVTIIVLTVMWPKWLAYRIKNKE